MARVALTFDDGPSEWTGPILDLLAENGARATFFVIGSLAGRRPELLERIVADGHEVGNHSWSHPHLARDCDDERVRSELAQTSDALEAILGLRPVRFRCPYYDVDERVETIAAGLGLRHTPGTVTPPDWRPGVRGGFLATLVLQLLRPDGIVGLHDGAPPHEADTPGVTRAATVEALATALPRLRERGFDCLTASQLLDGPG